MSKIIVHIDLDAFFCRAEEIKNPSLEGTPFIVGGDGRKGIVQLVHIKQGNMEFIVVCLHFKQKCYVKT